MSEQPAPMPNNQVHVADEAVKYMQRRKALGIERYKTPLQPHNGRDALVDALEEAVDLVMHLSQAIIERDGQMPSSPAHPDR